MLFVYQKALIPTFKPIFFLMITNLFASFKRTHKLNRLFIIINSVLNDGGKDFDLQIWIICDKFNNYANASKVENFPTQHNVYI
jgi:hypothetical protein